MREEFDRTNGNGGTFALGALAGALVGAGLGILFAPKTGSAISGVKEAADATLREEIEKGSHAIVASSAKQRDFWRGRGAATVQELWARYDGPKPCVWGCDAHDLSRVGKPDDQRYCWIKGLPTFDALHQACIDPERAYVGSAPPWSGTPSQVIDALAIENAQWARRLRST